MGTSFRFNLGYLFFAVIAIFFVHEMWQNAREIEVVPYSTFETMLTDGRIATVEIGDEQLVGRLKLADGAKNVVIANRVDAMVAERMSRFGIPYSQIHESKLLHDLLSWFAPALVFIGLWYFMARRIAGQGENFGGLMSIGKSRAKVYVEKETGVNFADVAGVDEAKAELEEVVEFLKEPKRHERLGARIPKGILLVGPPGTGKTLLARAVAGEAGVAFFSISGAEFVEMFVGVGAARVRDLFEQARQKAPAIIFIDELDALGRARGTFGIGGHDEKEQTLNQLLAELDGFDPSTGVVLLAATNRPEILDSALLRAGRFDRQVLVDRPDKKGRVQILQVHLRKIKLDPKTDVDQIAALTTGFSGADLANLVNEAALLATRRNAQEVALEDFTRAVERIVAGLEKRSRVLNAQERRIVAHHEMGHALVAMSLPGSDPVHKVSIIPRGIGALGYTIQRPTEDRFLMSRAELENKMAVLLGGRAAEEIVFGEFSTGAADDLVKVANIARAMVMRYGMAPSLGDVSYEEEHSPFLDGIPVAPKRGHSEETAREIDIAVRGIVAIAHDKALAVLRREADSLRRSATLLMERETFSEEDLAQFRPAAAG